MIGAVWCSLFFVIATSQGTAGLDIANVAIGTFESDGTLLTSISPPADGKNGGLAFDHTQQVKVTFAVRQGGSMFRPAQAVLRLTNLNSGAAAYFAAGKGASDKELLVTATANGIERQLGIQDGAYTASILVGDMSAETGVELPLGVELVVKYAPQEDGSQPQGSLTRMAAASKPQPEIYHVFRSIDKRASAAVSLPFTAVVIVPLLALMVAFSKARVSFKESSFILSDRLFALAFHSGILTIIFIYVAFWLGWNLLDMLPVLLAVGLVTAISGSFVLGGKPFSKGGRSKQE